MEFFTTAAVPPPGINVLVLFFTKEGTFRAAIGANNKDGRWFGMLEKEDITEDFRHHLQQDDIIKWAYPTEGSWDKPNPKPIPTPLPLNSPRTNQEFIKTNY